MLTRTLDELHRELADKTHEIMSSVAAIVGGDESVDRVCQVFSDLAELGWLIDRIPYVDTSAAL